MRPISLAVLLTLVGPNAALGEPLRPVASTVVRAAALAVFKAHDREGMYGVRVDSEACYRQFSSNPSWRQLDRCMTIDYVANAFIFGSHFDYPVILERWDAAARRLGVKRSVLEARSQMIMEIMPDRALGNLRSSMDTATR